MHKLKSLNHFVQHNIQYHRKALLSSFHLNGHAFGIHSQTQKLEPPTFHSMINSFTEKYRFAYSHFTPVLSPTLSRLNPLSSNSDEHQFSPYNINRQSRGKVMGIYKMTAK